MWQVWLNLNVNLNVGYKHIAKNAIYSGFPELIFVTEDITMIGYIKIYNERELWKKLEIEETSKRNIVVELYKKYGFEDMMELIEGDYSFLLLDYNIHGEESLLYVARDPFGIYPLYYYDNPPEYSYSFTIESDIHKNKIYIPFAAGHYQKFSHSHKVSSSWKRIDPPQSFYKLPFFSIYDEVNTTCKQTQIELAIKKRVDWIHYKYPEVESNIGCICSTDYNRNSNSNSFVPIILPTDLLPLDIAKYMVENMPNIKHVFLVEPFTYDWIEKKYLDRRKRITQLYLDASMQDWTNVFLNYGIEIYMPFLDRILIQNLKPVEML
jgi:hypothetical protein